MVKTKPQSETGSTKTSNGEHVIRHKDSTQPAAQMIFLDWINPPIGLDMSQADPAHPNYRVKIMVVGVQGGSTVLMLPFAEPVVWNPSVQPPTRWQFQMIGVSPNDPASLEYYMTMTVSQGTPGLQTIRSRIFTTPLASPDPSVSQVIKTGSLVAGSPATIQVNGVVDSSNNTVSVRYNHVVINSLTIDPGGPRDLFLQQPWTS
jgi:hypothetical protein